MQILVCRLSFHCLPALSALSIVARLQEQIAPIEIIRICKKTNPLFHLCGRVRICYPNQPPVFMFKSCTTHFQERDHLQQVATSRQSLCYCSISTPLLQLRLSLNRKDDDGRACDWLEDTLHHATVLFAVSRYVLNIFFTISHTALR